MSVGYVLVCLFSLILYSCILLELCLQHFSFSLSSFKGYEFLTFNFFPFYIIRTWNTSVVYLNFLFLYYFKQLFEVMKIFFKNVTQKHNIRVHKSNSYKIPLRYIRYFKIASIFRDARRTNRISSRFVNYYNNNFQLKRPI